MIAAVKPNNFDALWLAIGRPELVSDPRFGTVKGRAEHASEIVALLDDWASTRTVAECEAILTEGNVPCSRYSTIGETLQQPHVEDRGSYAVINDGAGALKVPNPPFQMRNTNGKARSYVATLGADNVDVLEKILGYSSERIAALYDRKVLVCK